MYMINERGERASREVAEKLPVETMRKLRSRLNVEEPDFTLMQELYDAGLFKCPTSGMPIFNPSVCSDALRSAIWRVYCGVATCVNATPADKATEAASVEAALNELKRLILEHAAPKGA